MGNSQGNPIRNIDKRTARREYKDVFCRSILEYQLDHGIDPSLPSGGSEQRILNFGEDTTSNVRVLVRKRPIFQHEVDGHEFDVATCIDDKNITIHDTRMHADMRRMLLTNNNFEFDGVFDEWASNDEVYASAARPLVKEAVSGGFATACVYGQTGSGKSFTMTSFYEKAAFDIFKELDDRYGRFDAMPRVSMTFFELQGDTCLDLLNCFQSTQLLTAVDGGVHAIPCVEPTVRDANEMVELIRHSLSIRTTAATGVHDASSRSHAILRIFIEQPAAPSRADSLTDRGFGEGVLTLVDLAGSEQSIDSMYHTAERRKEGAAINSSLMALKECIRARASGKAPTHFFRKSKLTMALKNSFILPTARTVIVATVSPSSKDTEHSLNTLRHACLMDGQDNDNGGENRFVTGGVKSKTVEVGQVNVTEIARKNKALKAEGKEQEEKTSNGNSFGSALNKRKEKEPTEKERAKARRMADRRGISRLSAGTKGVLEKHRDSLGCEQQQLERMRRAAATPPSSSQGPSRADSRSSSLDRGQTGPGSVSDQYDEPYPTGSTEPVYKIANTNECSSAENSPRASYDFSPRSSREFSPRGREGASAVHSKTTTATAESRKKATELLESRRQQKMKLKQELERLEREEEEEERREKQRGQASHTSYHAHAYVDVDVTRSTQSPGGTEMSGPQSPYSPYGESKAPSLSLPDAGLVEGSYNKRTMLANREEQTFHKEHAPPPQRKSHMSSYGGMSNTSGARNAVVHDTMQSRETRPVDMRVVQTRNNAPVKAYPSLQAKENSLAEAMRKVEKDAALKEMRRERARAVMRAKDGPSREAARVANRAASVDTGAGIPSLSASSSASTPDLTSASSLVDREAELRASRREQAQAIRDAKDEEKRQIALKRLHRKGFSVTKNSNNSNYNNTSELPGPGPSSSGGSGGGPEQDFEIKRLEKQLIANRYQPQAKQHDLKKQLASLKAAKLRRERGEIDRRESSSSSRPGTGSGAGADSDEVALSASRRASSSAEGDARRILARPSSAGRENLRSSGNAGASPRSPRSGPSYGRVRQSPPGTSPPHTHMPSQSLRLGAAAAPWGNSYNS